MTKLNQLSLALIAVLGLLTPALAAAPASTIKVERPWARSTPPMAKTAAAYMTIVNTGSEPDTLLSASTPVAGMAQVHHSFVENGIEKMRPAGPLELKPGASLKLSPGGYHVMIMDLKQPLTAGHDFPMTLTFAKAGKIEVSVHVQSTGPGKAPADMGQMNMPPGSKMDMK